MRMRMEWCLARSRSPIVMLEMRTPSMKVPSAPTRHVFSLPYCEPSSFHQSRRVDAALVAEIARRRPGADGGAVDPERDVGGPVGIGARHLRGELHREFERLDAGLAGSWRCSGTCIRYSRARTRSAPPATRFGSRKKSGTSRRPMMPSVEQRPHGRAHLAAGIEAERHRHLDHVSSRFGSTPSKRTMISSKRAEQIF